MNVNDVYISGFFSEKDKEELILFENQLREQGVSLYVRNLNGVIMHAAFDFADYEVVAFGYELIKNMVYAGGYDVAKYFVLKLWNFVTKGRKVGAAIPFTLEIQLGVLPSTQKKETLKIKCDGDLSDQLKEKVLDRAFALAEKVCDNEYELKARDQFYNAVGGHVFSYDHNEDCLNEIDIAAEVRKRAHKT